MELLPLLLFFHVAAAAVWVGGMFFAHQCLRPVAADLLEPPLRLRLWRRVLARFLAWVWLCVALIAATGLLVLNSMGFAAAPRPWHAMLGFGLVMMGIFAYVFFVPFAALRRAVAAEEWKYGAAALAQIRRLVGVNLALGFLTIAIATLGRFLGRVAAARGGSAACRDHSAKNLGRSSCSASFCKISSSRSAARRRGRSL